MEDPTQDGQIHANIVPRFSILSKIKAKSPDDEASPEWLKNLRADVGKIQEFDSSEDQASFSSEISIPFNTSEPESGQPDNDNQADFNTRRPGVITALR